jgi:putative restriction endonuclease
MSLSDYCDKFGRLIVNTQNGRASPHKICMLLAVLDLARAGALKESRTDLSGRLCELDL